MRLNILMNCSSQKRHSMTMLPLLDLYLGAAQGQRRWLAEHHNLFILSAKHGIRHSSFLSATYDLRGRDFSAEEQRKFRWLVHAQLKHLPTMDIVAMTSDYLMALPEQRLARVLIKPSKSDPDPRLNEITERVLLIQYPNKMKPEERLGTRMPGRSSFFGFAAMAAAAEWPDCEPLAVTKRMMNPAWPPDYTHPGRRTLLSSL